MPVWYNAYYFFLSADLAPSTPPVIVVPEESSTFSAPGPNMPLQDVVKSLIDFLASR